MDRSSHPAIWPRITDLSALEPENFKYRNTQFLSDEGQPYETGFDRSYQELRNRIWRVRNEDISKLLRRFPTDEPLREQCALWVHAVVGKHFFPDANHRTAIALLRKLLAENGIVYASWNPDRLKRAREESHTVREALEPVTLNTLYRRDELYDVWLRFFDDEVTVVSVASK